MQESFPVQHPEPPPGPSLGLALSGGGFRAMLFHLGLLAYLRDVGLLSRVRHISAVSGGSVVAAHLVLHWSRYLKEEAFTPDGIAMDLIRFARSDLRGKVVRRAYSLLRLLPFLSRWSATRWLEHFYARDLYPSGKLRDLAPAAGEPRPTLHLLTTELESGAPCSFSAEGFTFDLRDGAARPLEIADQSVARAVAASSAFPALFAPIILTPRNVGRRRDDFGPRDRLVLTDGGVYDNLGVVGFLPPFQAGQCDVLIVSDASRLSDWTRLSGTWSPIKYLAGLQRSYDIASARLYTEQIGRLSESSSKDAPREVIQARIHDLVEPGEGRLPREDQIRLRDIRTDFDRFTDIAIRALTVHGWSVARARTESLVRRLRLDPRPKMEPWDPYREQPEELSEALVDGQPPPPSLDREAYKRVQRRQWRLLARDWPTVLQGFVLAAIVLLGILWIRASWPGLPERLDPRIDELPRDPAHNWLQSLNSQYRDEMEGEELTDYRILRIVASPHPCPTASFKLRIKFDGDILRITPFRVATSFASPSYEPLVWKYLPDSEGRECEITASRCERKDEIWIVAVVGLRQGELPIDNKNLLDSGRLMVALEKQE